MKVVSQAERIISQEKLEQMAKKQLEMELRGTVTVKSIEKKDNLENLAHYVSGIKKYSFSVSCFEYQIAPLIITMMMMMVEWSEGKGFTDSPSSLKVCELLCSDGL